MVSEPENAVTREDEAVETAPVEVDASVGPSPDMERAQLEGRVIEALREIFDPEIPVNIYELGLIYDVDITGMNEVRIQMTLTSPHCPVAESLPIEVETKTKAVDGVTDVAIDLVWEPPWTPDRMSEAAKLELGFM